MRHSVAEPTSTTDFERKLTAQGVEKAELVAQQLLQRGVSPGAIVHSPLVRSQQTALAFRKYFPAAPLIELQEVVTASSSLFHVLGSGGWKDPLVIGHNPSISMLASALSDSDKPLSFHTCSFAAFEVNQLPPTKAKLIQWLPHPE